MKQDRINLYRLAFILAVVTILYNVAEGLVSLWFGVSDESLALLGFGLDSLIEVVSGIGIVHMIFRIRQHDEGNRSSFEKTALQITGTSFYLLAAGLVLTGVYNLFTHHKPETTFWGIVISLVSIFSMVILIYLKLKTGRKLNSDAIIADARCTRICLYMSVILLISSLAFEFTGFGWIDTLGTFGLAWFSFTEGRESFEKAVSGGECGCCKSEK